MEHVTRCSRKPLSITVNVVATACTNAFNLRKNLLWFKIVQKLNIV